MSRIRTFVAIDVNDEVRRKTARLMRDLSPEYKWVEPENLHLTLKFLGDVPEEDVADVCRHVERACDGVESFPISIEGLGAFPDDDRPRVIWAGVGEGQEELCELHGRIERELKKMRFPEERQTYRPHLTLGRKKHRGRYDPAMVAAIRENAPFYAGDFMVQQIVVYASYLDKRGPSYTPMARVNLG